MSTTANIRPAESEEDSFGPLMDRLNSVIHRLKLAAEVLGEVAETPAKGHHSAAFVVVEVTKELVQLQCDLENWTIRDFPGIGPEDPTKARALTDGGGEVGDAYKGV